MSFTRSEIAGGSWSTPFGTPFFVWNGDGYTKVPMDRLRAEYIAWEQARIARSMMSTSASVPFGTRACLSVMPLLAAPSDPEPVKEAVRPAFSSWADEVEDELFGGDEVEDPVADAVNVSLAVDSTADTDDNFCNATTWGIKGPAPKSWADDVEDELFGGSDILEDNVAPSSYWYVVEVDLKLCWGYILLDISSDIASEGRTGQVDVLIDGLPLSEIKDGGIESHQLEVTHGSFGDGISPPGPLW